MNAVDGYGDDSIRVIYDVAKAHFIGEFPTDGLRRVRDLQQAGFGSNA